MPNRIIFASLCLLILNVSASENLVFSTGQGVVEQEVSIQVINEAYQRIAQKFVVLQYPNMRSLVEANSGHVDGELSRISHIDQQFENLLQVPIAINSIEGYALWAQNIRQIVNWESLRGYKLVCVRGVQFVEQNLSLHNIHCDPVTTFSQAVNLLQRGRYDVAVLPKNTGLNAVKNNQAKDVYIQGERLIKIDLYHYLHKKNKIILPKITAVLQEMQGNGRISEIRAEYRLEHNLKRKVRVVNQKSHLN